MTTVLVASFLSYFRRRKASSKRHAYFSKVDNDKKTYDFFQWLPEQNQK